MDRRDCDGFSSARRVMGDVMEEIRYVVSKWKSTGYFCISAAACGTNTAGYLRGCTDQPGGYGWTCSGQHDSAELFLRFLQLRLCNETCPIIVIPLIFVFLFFLFLVLSFCFTEDRFLHIAPSLASGVRVCSDSAVACIASLMSPKTRGASALRDMYGLSGRFVSFKYISVMRIGLHYRGCHRRHGRCFPESAN